jgi:dipeptidyl aminopeptidase/acylaminoacyl peptidase
MTGSSPFDVRSGADYAVSDPAVLDPDFPTEQFVTYFKSEGSVVHATMWIASGAEPKPCVIVSPQIFGGDRLESLIIPLLNSGIHVCTFHPRGMWDKENEFGFISALDDIHAAVEFLRNSDVNGSLTTMGKPYRIDPKRIAVTGLSGGGGSLGLASCAENPHIHAAIAIAPGNFELNRGPDGIAPMLQFFDAIKARSDGRIDLERWLTRLTDADFDRISPITQAPKLVDKPVLLIGGSRDVVTPIDDCHRPIAAAIKAAGAKRFTEVILETDHGFLTKRIALARLVISWLKTECQY